MSRLVHNWCILALRFKARLVAGVAAVATTVVAVVIAAVVVVTSLASRISCLRLSSSQLSHRLHGCGHRYCHQVVVVFADVTITLVISWLSWSG
jgi:hypothetical protein